MVLSRQQLRWPLYSARQYLVSLGVDSGRLETVSYGEERPLCTESGESCWRLNRRAHFMVAGHSKRT